MLVLHNNDALRILLIIGRTTHNNKTNNERKPKLYLAEKAKTIQSSQKKQRSQHERKKHISEYISFRLAGCALTRVTRVVNGFFVLGTLVCVGMFASRVLQLVYIFLSRIYYLYSDSLVSKPETQNQKRIARSYPNHQGYIVGRVNKHYHLLHHTHRDTIHKLSI